MTKRVLARRRQRERQREAARRVMDVLLGIPICIKCHTGIAFTANGYRMIAAHLSSSTGDHFHIKCWPGYAP